MSLMMRLSLQLEKSDKFWEKHFETNEGFQYSISVGIKSLDSDKIYEPIKNGILLNKIILDEHHDFARHY